MSDASSSSSDEDEAIGATESNAHAQVSHDERKRQRKDKDKKEKKEKKEKKHKKEKKEKKEKHKHKDKKAKRGDDPAALAAARAMVEASMQPIAEGDYFLRTKEFQLWLSEARKTFLDEIPAEEARALFRKFVAKWNAKELPPKYYVGLPVAEGADGATRASRHQWGFTAKITEQEGT